MSLTYVNVGALAQSASATSLAVNKATAPPIPNLAAARTILVAAVFVKNNDTITTATSGWFKVSQTNSGASFTCAVFIALGNAANPTFTWTNSAACAGSIATFDGAVNPLLATAIGGSSTNSGTANPHTTTSFNTVRAVSQVVYVDMCAANTALAAPSGWTEHTDIPVATAVGRIVFGSKAVPNAGSASGAISVNGGAAAWVQTQIELMMEEPATGHQNTETALETVYSFGAGLANLETEIAVVYAPVADPGFAVADTEIAVVYSNAPPVVVSSRRRPLYLN